MKGDAMTIRGKVWIGSEDSDEYWCEGGDCSAVVEAVDVDEVRLGLILDGDETEATTLYLSRKEADRLSRFLAAASVSEVQVRA